MISSQECIVVFLRFAFPDVNEALHKVEQCDGGVAPPGRGSLSTPPRSELLYIKIKPFLVKIILYMAVYNDI